MSKITKERIEQFANDPMMCVSDEVRELARIALASLEAEPVAFRSKLKPPSAIGSENWDYTEHRQPDAFELENCVIELLYTVPPATASESEPMKMFGIGSVFKPKILSGDEVDCDNCAHYQPNVCHGEGCPAAMLQGAENIESRCTIQTAPALDSSPKNAESRCGKSPVILDGLIAAVNRLLDTDGSRGCYSANCCHDAHEEVERLLAAAPQQEVKP